MIYTQIVWALAVDRALFQITTNAWALLGAATIISSLCLVTVVGEGRQFGGGIYTHLTSEEDEYAERLSLDELHAEQISL
jgi:hypothetical protein